LWCRHLACQLVDFAGWKPAPQPKKQAIISGHDPRRRKMKPARKKILDAVILHGVVLGSWLIFRLVKLRSIRFQKALENFNATYQFRTGSMGRLLIFSDGNIATRRGIVPEPDYELVLLDPLGVLKRLAKNPDDVIKLLMENKIDQRGNNYYLFKFGYLLGLCQRWFQELLIGAYIN
jgi:hypothetical protein